MNLTKREQEIIIEQELGPNVNVSLGQPLHARMRAMFEQEADRYGWSFSSIIKEACHCLLHFGPDWRAKTNGNTQAKLDKVINMIANLKVVAQSGDSQAITDEVNKMFSDEGGFSK